MRIVVLDPESTDPTWMPFEDSIILTVPDDADDAEIAERIREAVRDA